jgi:hypothetical protein
MALDNIARRLQALYGEDAGVVSEQREGLFIARLQYRVSLPESGGQPQASENAAA